MKKIYILLAVIAGIMLLAAAAYIIYLFIDFVIPMIPTFLYSLLRII